ncbi:hypothetical protein Slala03_34690 [Streptomyces lavendulae subsp. lavendulae]|nr:hypothetical protein Slala03_34690 [Streptomyces lavendulae subsp. lavendulae]GLX38091.1 hypothetical protein Sros01_41640 [Streptomyces roseochromogenus]
MAKVPGTAREHTTPARPGPRPRRRGGGAVAALPGHKDAPPILVSSDSAVRTGSPGCAPVHRYGTATARPREPTAQ